MYDVKIDTLEVFVLLSGVPGKYAKNTIFSEGYFRVFWPEVLAL